MTSENIDMSSIISLSNIDLTDLKFEFENVTARSLEPVEQPKVSR